MTNLEAQKILRMYDDANKLKELVRSGWNKWKLNDKVRHESVAEHIYGCCMFTLAYFSNVENKKNLDINKIFLMLTLHEIEEIFIGDLTPFDDTSTKKEKGHLAVLKFFEDAENGQMFIDLINEFEESKTEEAKFCHRVDKFEAFLQARKYDKNFQLKKVSSNVIDNEKIKSYRLAGHTKVSTFFYLHDKEIFDEDFLTLAEEIFKNDKK